MKTALVTGITGQDGSYMAELLLAKEYRVVGLTRNVQTSEGRLPDALAGRVDLVGWDPRDQAGIADLLRGQQADELYNFAAYSSGAGMFDHPVDIGEINGLAVARMLEAIQGLGGSVRFCQASSSELFGEPKESPQSEATPFQPRSPYGAAKLYAHHMIRIYRERYGLFACSAILFNHESPRRGVGFVARKITREAARIKLGISAELSLGNLDARRDWGYAGDYVGAMWLMLQQPRADDYVVATGQTHSVRELCDVAFRHVGLDYRDYVRENASDFRPPEQRQLVGDAGKAASRLGWRPEKGFKTVIEEMVDEDLRLLRTQATATDRSNDDQEN